MPLPPILLTCARIPAVAVGLPLVAGWLSGMGTYKVVQGRWFKVCSFPTRRFSQKTYSSVEPAVAESVPAESGVPYRVDEPVPGHGLGITRRSASFRRVPVRPPKPPSTRADIRAVPGQS